MLETSFTRRFGLTAPLVQAPMGGVAGPALVAAAAEAGALGVLPVWFLPVEQAVAMVQRTQQLTRRPFAVNLRADLVQVEHLAAALDLGVRWVHLFWGDPRPCVRPFADRHDLVMLATVWDDESVRHALDAGAAALIAQGVEAGGHVRGTMLLAELLCTVDALAGSVPVAAAGGLVDAGDVAAVLRLGADAAVLGTRLVVTAESDAHDEYKRALLAAGDDATVLSTCFDGQWPDAPHRTLRNSTYLAWHAAGRPAAGSRPGEGDVVMRMPNGDAYPRYSMALPTRDSTGEVEAAALYAGTGVGRIDGVPAAGSLIAAIQRELTTLMEQDRAR